jgi:hypothetical protein
MKNYFEIESEIFKKYIQENENELMDLDTFIKSSLFLQNPQLHDVKWLYISKNFDFAFSTAIKKDKFSSEVIDTINIGVFVYKSSFFKTKFDKYFDTNLYSRKLETNSLNTLIQTIKENDNKAILKITKLDDLIIALNTLNEIYRKKIHLISNEENKIKLEQKNNDLNNFFEYKKNKIAELDKNGDGKIDLIENDFNKIVAKNQHTIISKQNEYVHKFVKISKYISAKQQNIQCFFVLVKKAKTYDEVNHSMGLLKNQIHLYELLVFNALNMLGALLKSDLITFYEIYESFDKLGMFNSNWENEISEKLTNIGNKLDSLMNSIYNMEKNIIRELSHLSYVTQDSFADLNRSVTTQLREVESSINTNNLLTAIQAYQLYKINRNTKGLRQ